jgi:hypothetical protein
VQIVGSATYLQERARRRLSGGTLLAGIGGTLFVLSVVLAEMAGEAAPGIAGLASFLGLGLLLIGVLRIFSSRRYEATIAGEGPVVNQLAARLDDDFVYLRHVALGSRGAEADGVLLGPHGALVLAIRALNGTFVVRGHDWYAVDEHGDERAFNRSPSWELVRTLQAVQRVLKEEGLGEVPVQGAVVLVRGRLADAELPGTAIVPLERIGSFVDYLRPAELLPPEPFRRAIEVLTPHVDGRRSGVRPRGE